MSSSQPLLTSTQVDLKGQVPIGVIGSGNYATALTQRLSSVGYDVVIGSRHPSKRESAMLLSGSCLCGVEVTSIERCISLCDVIFVAIHMENYKVTLAHHSAAARNKILVDISNREYRYAKVSNAQRLSDVMPNSYVVKAFNTVSPAMMEISVNTLSNPKVYVASDDKSAKKKVMDVAKNMGFGAIDYGDLKTALYLEDFVLRVFTRWKLPMFVTFLIFNLWSLYVIYIYFIAGKDAFNWEQLFLKVLNKPVCMTAITVVSLTYMPGQIAAILQVFHGTKHQRFPKFLDGWLKCRKQLGIISYLLVTFHVIASTLMMSPTYYRSWYHQPEVTIPANLSLTSSQTLPVSTAWMVWKGEAALLLGISAFLVMSIIAVTSIPSVGEALNWSEWRCVHSNMGTAFLLLAVVHVIAMGAPGWAKKGFSGSLGSITLLSIVLPVSVLFSKMLFYFTPLRCCLRRVRKGHERKASTRNSSSTRPDKNNDSFSLEDPEICREELGLVTNVDSKNGGHKARAQTCSNAECVQPCTCAEFRSSSGLSNMTGHCQCSPV